MKTTWMKFSALALMALLTACGGGGGGGSGGTTPGGGGSTSATGVDWTWLGGSDVGGQPAVYTAASGVVAPGATEGGSSWTDSTGHLWLFGGSDESAAKDTNNLWMYDGANWVWVNGGQSVVNTQNNGSVGATNSQDAPGPGARQYAATWVDASNNLWLFGGYVRIDAAGTTKPANDLWKYNITSRQWTWVGGSSAHSQLGVYGLHTASAANVPGARYGALSWKDGFGNFWLFGGYGYAETGSAGALNDLWKFDGANWTWVSGTKLTNQLSVDGGKGASNVGYIPSGRYLGASWIDASNNLWLFGGRGYDKVGIGDFNDLWKFNTVNGLWTWVSGGNQTGLPGVFGTAGTPAPANVPGARRTAVSWADSAGNFWLFGGAEATPTVNDAAHFDNLNDLWKFDGTNWVWMSGSNAYNQVGVYGTQGGTNPPESANVPGARDTAVAWVSGNTCWLLGGQVFVGQNFSTVPHNDFWKFVPK